MYIQINSYIYIYIHIYINICICTHIHMFACVRACVCVCKRCTSSYYICEPGMNRVNGLQCTNHNMVSTRYCQPN